MLLEEVANLIDGQRAQDYGEPQDSFDTIATFWSKYLGMDIDALMVADLMILLKVARNMGPRKTKDNYLDICGYGGLAGSNFVDVSKSDGNKDS